VSLSGVEVLSARPGDDVDAVELWLLMSLLLPVPCPIGGSAALSSGADPSGGVVGTVSPRQAGTSARLPQETDLKCLQRYQG
jgi:hypothetical protein